MRTDIFLVGIIMVVLGPAITIASFTSCLGTILIGHLFACVTDLAYILIGGVLFVVGILTAIIGLFLPESPPPPSYLRTAGTAGAAGNTQLAQVACRKCGRVYSPDRFFCPFCGQTPG